VRESIPIKASAAARRVIGREAEIQRGFGLALSLECRLTRRIAALTSRSSAFKVGIANWPERRKRQYERDHPRRFSEIVVLYETASHRNASRLESLLIDCNWDRYELRNETGGGGGRRGEGLNYLHVARRSSPAIK